MDSRNTIAVEVGIVVIYIAGSIISHALGFPQGAERSVRKIAYGRFDSSCAMMGVSKFWLGT